MQRDGVHELIQKLSNNNSNNNSNNDNNNTNNNEVYEDIAKVDFYYLLFDKKEWIKNQTLNNKTLEQCEYVLIKIKKK